MNVRRSWLSMCLSGATCRYRVRCRNFSSSFRMRQRALHILSAPDGVMDLSVRTVGRRIRHGTFSRGLGCFAAVIAATIQASRPAPSWRACTRRSRYGFGRPISSPVRHRASLQFSSNASSDCRATKQPFRFSTSCVSVWCALIRTGSVESPVSTSRPTKHLCRWPDTRGRQRHAPQDSCGCCR